MTPFPTAPYLLTMRARRLSSLVASIRIRYLLLVTAILGVIFFLLAYLGISQARQSLLKIMVDEGKALVASLTLASTNAIQAGLLLESLSEERFADLAAAGRQRLIVTSDPRAFRQFRDENALISVDLLDSAFGVIGSDRWTTGYLPNYPPEVAVEMRDLRLTGGGYRSVIIAGDTTEPVVQYFIYAYTPEGDWVVMAAEAEYMDQITRKIGIGHLIQSISDQAGIVYILLQSRSGIIFSSRPLEPIPAISGDPFLDSLMQVDTTGWRIDAFEGREVLEIARRFESVAYPPGVFRIGMDLDEYDDISRGYDRQVITLAVVLFLLTVLLVAVVSVNQNYFILDRSYRRIQSLTETAFDRLSSAVLAIDGERKIIAVNKAFIEICGIDSGVIGKSLSDISGACPFEIPDVVHPGERLLSVEKQVVTSSGRERVYLLGLSALPDDAGGGMILLAHDITEQKRLEAENRRRERLSEMGDMAAGVAHEIRNPLNAIAIAAQRLKLEFAPGVDKDDYDRLTRNILDETARLNQILTRFLELARVKAAEEAPVDLAEAIGRAIASLADEAAAAEVTIAYQRHDPVAVRGNRERLQQVFINLFKNSTQAMPDGGHITVTVTPDENSRVTIGVADTGPGFAADILPKIFQPYFTTKADGSGLGLALAYKTITECGGEISAANNSGEGAVITIVLPTA